MYCTWRTLHWPISSSAESSINPSTWESAWCGRFSVVIWWWSSVGVRTTLAEALPAGVQVISSRSCRRGTTSACPGTDRQQRVTWQQLSVKQLSVDRIVQRICTNQVIVRRQTSTPPHGGLLAGIGVKSTATAYVRKDKLLQKQSFQLLHDIFINTNWNRGLRMYINIQQKCC